MSKIPKGEQLERSRRLEDAKKYLDEQLYQAHLWSDRDKIIDLGHFHEAIQQAERAEQLENRLQKNGKKFKKQEREWKHYKSKAIGMEMTASQYKNLYEARRNRVEQLESENERLRNILDRIRLTAASPGRSFHQRLLDIEKLVRGESNE